MAYLIIVKLLQRMDVALFGKGRDLDVQRRKTPLVRGFVGPIGEITLAVQSCNIVHIAALARELPILSFPGLLCLELSPS